MSQLLTIDPSGFDWIPAAAGETSPSVAVTNGGDGDEFDYTVASDSTWLTLSAASGTTPGSFTMIAAANTGAARSAIVTVTAAGISGSPKTIAVYQAAPAGIALVDLTTTVRSLLGGPATTEISDAQLAICWRRAVDEYSKYRPIREYYYGAGVVLVADQTAYSVPDETFDIKACRIYATLQEVKDNLKYFEDYQEAGPGLTGYGSFYWSFNNNKMELSDIPAAADAGKFIGMLIYKGHVFTAGTCTTIPRKEFEGHLLNWCKGDALETWAGYQGSVRFGSSSEDREPLRDEARKLKEAAVKFWSTGII